MTSPRPSADRSPRLLHLLLSAVAITLAGSAFALPGCGVPDASEPQGTYELDFSLPEGSQTRSVVCFLVDGLNPEIFQEMLDAGQLPAIKKYFVDRGLYCPAAVANTPSVTLANETSVVTGVWPGHHGVTGINWWDRNTLVWRNYETIAQKNTLAGDYLSPTLYERLPDRTTVSIFYQAHRGATKFVENWTSAGPPFFFGWYEFVDRLTLSRFDLVMHIARTRREMPAFTMVYMLAPDFRAYAEGVSSDAYRQAIRHTDTQLGRVLADMDRDGLLEKVHLVLLSDHSLMDVDTHLPLDNLLTSWGLDVADKRLWEKTPFEKRQDYYRRFNCVLYGSGDRYWAIQLRKPRRDETGRVTGYHAWTRRPSVEDLKNYPICPDMRERFGRDANAPATGDLLEAMIWQKGVDAIAYATGENRVRVRRHRGEIEFHQPDGPGGRIAVTHVDGSDPLGWKTAVPADVLDGKRSLTPDEWLDATAGTQFPDLPPQIVAYFRARRAGDIAVFAAPGWDFGTKNRAGHGGLRPLDLHVPLIVAGPGVPRGTLKTARTVDVVPTVLELLGRPIPDGLDGRSLLGRAKRDRPE